MDEDLVDRLIAEACDVWFAVVYRVYPRDYYGPGEASTAEARVETLWSSGPVDPWSAEAHRVRLEAHWVTVDRRVRVDAWPARQAAFFLSKYPAPAEVEEEIL